MSETPPNIEVRRVRAQDMPDLARLYALLSDDPVPEPTDHLAAFDDVEADVRQTVLIAEVDGRLAGSATVIVVPNLRTPGRPYAIVENVVVDETARRCGVGTALMRATIVEQDVVIPENSMYERGIVDVMNLDPARAEEAWQELMTHVAPMRAGDGNVRMHLAVQFFAAMSAG